jgi:DNA-binding winged helix-turn-helix (wHTH) protein
MVILFLTTQEAICSKIASCLSANGHIVQIFTDPQKFYTTVLSAGADKIDLLACDYLSFGGDEIDLFTIMQERHCVIPLFYYNTPFPAPDDRAFFWYENIKRRQANFLLPEKLKALLPELVRIQDIINRSDVYPYIRLLNPPEELPPGGAGAAKALQIDLDAFRRKHHIQAARFPLLQYLYEHRNEELEVCSICEYLWHDASKEKISTLYSYIHDLRRAFEREEDFYIAIEHPAKRCYSLVLRESKDAENGIPSAKEFFARRRPLDITF